MLISCFICFQISCPELLNSFPKLNSYEQLKFSVKIHFGSLIGLTTNLADELIIKMLIVRSDEPYENEYQVFFQYDRHRLVSDKNSKLKNIVSQNFISKITELQINVVSIWEVKIHVIILTKVCVDIANRG